MTPTSSDPLNPTLEALLADSLTRALMAADGIGIEEMRKLLQAAWIAAEARQVVPLDGISIEDAERYALK